MSMLGILMAAAVAIQSLPLMKANDPTAQFQADTGVIKFDPACRDYTLTTVQSNRECAVRLANGQTAVSLAIALSTIANEPIRASEAIATVERAVAVENHPAAHYLLGMLLGTGQGIVPRYQEAVRHLEIASKRGNPAAADLLASLIVQGKGTARDIPRAVALYKMAIAGGFLGSASSLAQLYLNGRYLPIDRDFGARLLEEAARLGDVRAAQLAPLARTDKIHNFQLLPAADPAKVKAKEFDTFTNPDIPPNFGFDEAFQAIHYQPFDKPALLTELKATAKFKPTPYLYELAKREGPNNPTDALRHYALARTRMTYDASRCSDPAALEAIRAWDILIVRDIAFLFKTVSKVDREQAIKNAMDDERSFPADTVPWWVCRSGMTEMSNAMEGKVGALALKPASAWPNLREEARKKVTATFATIP